MVNTSQALGRDQSILQDLRACACQGGSLRVDQLKLTLLLYRDLNSSEMYAQIEMKTGAHHRGVPKRNGHLGLEITDFFSALCVPYRPVPSRHVSLLEM